MRIGAFMMILALLSESCGERPGNVEIKVVAAGWDSVVIGVRNHSRNEVVLLSPATPSRQVDEDKCAVYLSTRVDERIRPYAFTPELVTVTRGSEMKFRASNHPFRLSKRCGRWDVTAEYAYIRPDEVENFAARPSEEFLAIRLVESASGNLP